MKTVRFRVPNISCGHCVATIERELNEIAGVRSVAASSESKLVDVEFEPPATKEQIVAILTEWDFPPSE